MGRCANWGAETSCKHDADIRFLARNLNFTSRLSDLWRDRRRGVILDRRVNVRLLDNVCPRLGRCVLSESCVRDLCESSTVHKVACELRVLLASGKHLGDAW